MIELAPKHKLGLPVERPVLLASGSVGYGECLARGLKLNAFGAVVVGPITRQSLPGRSGPRSAEGLGGFVLDAGEQNRSARIAQKKFGRLWGRLPCPVIAHIADDHAFDAAATAQALFDASALRGLELRWEPKGGGDSISDLISAVRRESDLPLWVKLPCRDAKLAGQAAAAAGADALVVSSPPTGSAVLGENRVLTGPYFGPAAFAVMLTELDELARCNLGLPLIACGGIHSSVQLRQALACGAAAVQLDVISWLEPGTATALAQSA